MLTQFISLIVYNFLLVGYLLLGGVSFQSHKYVIPIILVTSTHAYQTHAYQLIEVKSRYETLPDW